MKRCVYGFEAHRKLHYSGGCTMCNENREASVQETTVWWRQSKCSRGMCIAGTRTVHSEGMTELCDFVRGRSPWLRGYSKPLCGHLVLRGDTGCLWVQKSEMFAPLYLTLRPQSWFTKCQMWSILKLGLKQSEMPSDVEALTCMPENWGWPAQDANPQYRKGTFEGSSRNLRRQGRKCWHSKVVDAREMGMASWPPCHQ